MRNLRFQVWVRQAVSRIVLTQDRIRVGRELMDHMEDRYQNYLDQGTHPREAEALTISTMGNPEALSHQLGVLHRPFWGYCLIYSHRILAVLACLVLFCAGGRLLAEYFFIGGYQQPVYARYDPYRDTSISDHMGQLQRTCYLRPEDTVTSGGYTLNLTEAALWHSTYTDTSGQPQEEDLFHFRIQVTNPLPWAQHGNISRWFWAVDDLGNYYYATYEAGSISVPAVQGSIYHTGPMTYLHDLYLTDFISQDAQWIELHYDRAGRDLVLRMDLTGGEAA